MGFSTLTHTHKLWKTPSSPPEVFFPLGTTPTGSTTPDVEMGEMLRSSGSTSGGSTTPAATAAAAEALATLALATDE